MMSVLVGPEFQTWRGNSLRPVPDLIEIQPNGELVLRLHPGQLKIWNSNKRFLLALGGRQSGKTELGPLWLWREMQLMGPGDYLVVAPTYKILDKKALPAFRRLFETILQLGRYSGSPHQEFIVSPEGAQRLFGWYDPLTPTRVIFGHAQDPESLESATAKAAWLDEAGQEKFKLGSWEAILGRLALHMGRVLLTTTPYAHNWLKRKLFDPWRESGGDHPLIEVSQFDSIMNPKFPREEWERAKRDLPPWRFNMFYRAMFTKPAGLIYDSFDDERHVIDRFDIPEHWRRYVGLDFGGVNTAAVFYAVNPDEPRRYYLYRTYKAGGRTAAKHVEFIERAAGGPITACYGGSKAEGQWRSEFIAAGLVVLEPLVSDVEVGITRVYGAHARGDILVFRDLDDYIEEKLSYTREIDDDGNPTEAISNKQAYHFMDAERYVIGGWLERKVVDYSDQVIYLPFGNKYDIEDLSLPPMFRD